MIMEEKLGRKLTFNEIVHHKDGNSDNDDPNNLEVMTRSEHAKLHLTGRPLPERQKEYLSTFFKGKPNLSNTKLAMDDVTEIRSLSQQGLSMRKIGKMYGVHHNTISRLLSGKTLSYKEAT